MPPWSGWRGATSATAGLFLEKYIEHARHIEVQLFGDGAGTVIALGERDCSMQRRNQKVIEETAGARPHERDARAPLRAAVRLGSRGTLSIRGHGRVRLRRSRPSEFYFLEVNTRLQVEHGVTEEVTGVDLVEWMIRVAAGEPPDLGAYRYAPRGHAIQVRLYAEDPSRNFRPSSGLLSHVVLPEGRACGWLDRDRHRSLVVLRSDAREDHRARRRRESWRYGEAARRRWRDAASTASRPTSTICGQSWRHRCFRDGAAVHAISVELRVPAAARSRCCAPAPTRPCRIIRAASDYWNVGVPPSGPMDDLAFRLANRIVGNPKSAAALELTGTGPTLQFGVDSVIALTGATMTATLEGEQRAVLGTDRRARRAVC